MQSAAPDSSSSSAPAARSPAAPRRPPKRRLPVGARPVVGRSSPRSPAPAGVALESEQVAQVDSKDMDFATWRRLAARVAAAPGAARGGRASSSRTAPTRSRRRRTSCSASLAPAKPVVLTGAMRPATSRARRRPAEPRRRDRRRAGAAARTAWSVVVAGTVHSALDVRKVHPYRLDAFGSGDAGPIARVEEGPAAPAAAWPGDAGSALGIDALADDASAWPRVGDRHERRRRRRRTSARSSTPAVEGHRRRRDRQRPRPSLRSWRRCATRSRAAAPCCAARAAWTATVDRRDRAVGTHRRRPARSRRAGARRADVRLLDAARRTGQAPLASDAAASVRRRRGRPRCCRASRSSTGRPGARPRRASAPAPCPCRGC